MPPSSTLARLDGERRAIAVRVVAIVLVSVLLLTVVSALFVHFATGSPQFVTATEGFQFLLAVAITLCVAAGLLLLARGHLLAPVVLMVVVVFLAPVIGAITLGLGIQAPRLMLICLAIMLAGFLWGGRAAGLIAAAAIGLALLLFALGWNGALVPVAMPGREMDLAFLAVYLLLFLITGYISVRYSQVFLTALADEQSARTAAEAAREELRISEAHLRQAQAIARLGSWQLDIASDALMLSDTARAIFGIPVEDDLTGGKLTRFVHLEDRALVEAAGRSWGGPAPADIEFRILRAGEIRWVAVRLETPVAGGVVTGTIQDITERKSIEIELARHRDHLEREVAERTAELSSRNRQFLTILDGIPGPITYWDRELRPRFMNTAVLRQWNDTAERLAVRHMREIVGETTYRFLRPRAEAALAGEAQRFEFRYRRPDPPADMVTYEIHYIPDCQDGAVRGFFAVAFEITELRRAREAAEQANVAKSAFLATMSHEMRTPLNAITGMAHLVRRAGVTPQQAGRLDKLDTAAGHLLHIIEDVLDLARIESGELQLEEAPLALPALLEALQRQLAERAGAKGLELVVAPPPATVQLLGDAKRLQQALLNYAGNAIKFTERGSVNIAVAVEEETGDALLLRFSVTDTGIGIAPDVLPQLFAPFQQVDSSSTRRYGGTGLGLVITRRIAEAMGGGAGVSSTPGEGSTFWFTARLRTLPAAAVPAEAGTLEGGPDAETAVRARHAGSRVLLAEDDAFNRDLMVELLLQAGLQVDCAADGAAAVERAGSGAYALILMDLQMPKMGGLEAAARIRALTPGGGVPIVAFTANASAEDRARCLAAGMDDFLTKPVDHELLFATLLRWLDRGAR